MEQKTFYQTLGQKLKEGNHKIETVTILEGDQQGEKFLLEEGEHLQTYLPGFEESKVRVFRELLGGRPRMVICGGGHVSMPIIRMGKMLNFQVTVLEDRPKFADHARAAGADQVLCMPYEEGLGQANIDRDTYVVIVTRGHRYDSDCLYTVLTNETAPAYVGMMGSRRRTAIVKEQMKEQGVSETRLEEVHTPIGLAIGAETPEEIAVSILAEIIAVKNKGRSVGGFPEEILNVLTEDIQEQKKVLATIISRKGSAPRSVGTKMLILEDGTAIGTIGGGCAESDIMQKALLMMRMDTPALQICPVNMTSEEAEEEGMVCGGQIEVLLERV